MSAATSSLRFGLKVVVTASEPQFFLSGWNDDELVRQSAFTYFQYSRISNFVPVIEYRD